MAEMSEAETRRTRRDILKFYDAGRRALPWRGELHPYRVWVSEVMLQQTRVDTVLPYYRAWMERFPDLEALASASLDDVLKAWEGLGYYARARNLHRAALLVRDRMGGKLPARAAELRALPGFGEYTSGAVASIAFGECVPAVDGNARRVLARLSDEADPAPRWLRAYAAALVDPVRPGDFNQALMELGSTVCTAGQPACSRCPLARQCRARALGTVLERPRPRQRSVLPEREIAVAVLLRAGNSGSPELLLARRPLDGLLGGLWAFPSATLPLPGCTRRAVLAAATRAARAAGVLPRRQPTELPPFRNTYSHFRATYRPFVWNTSAPNWREPVGIPARHAWTPVEALEERALAAAYRRIARAVTAWIERSPGLEGGQPERTHDSPPIRRALEDRSGNM